MEQLINFDVYRIFSAKNAHILIDLLVKKYPQSVPESVIKFLDYNGEYQIRESISLPLQHTFHISYSENNQEEEDSLKRYQNTKLLPNLQLAERLPAHIKQKLACSRITTLQQLKLRCQANYYVTYHSFLQDFQSFINWNQLYRSTSIVSDIWITAFIQYFNKLTGQTFKQKFSVKKNDDILRLMKSQLAYKISCTNYPIVPTNFREYQLITQYVPTPKERTQLIENKMKSQKKPQQCPTDCPCLSSPDTPYCSFSLVQGTWQSGCKNRANRIQCLHSDPKDMMRCRNVEIRLGKGKTCRTEPQQQGQFDIEQCLIWGLDYYTRKNIIYSLPEYQVYNFKLIDNTETKSEFVNSLIKAANYNSVEGYNMKKACQYIIKNTQEYTKYPQSEGYVWSLHQITEDTDKMFSIKDRQYALHLLQVLNLGVDETGFRIHTKGKGARCLNKSGIKQSEFIVQYFGQVYELWRWYQRQDHTKRIMREQKLSNLPDFYNIYLEKHGDEPGGYDMLVIDPISHGNFASRFSHSCHPNCGTIITVSNGKYYIGMYALRNISIGEELTFDYCSITESNLEHIQAICLCGTKVCRGHYLQLGNAKHVNYILDQHNCFLNRNSALLHSCTQPFTEQDAKLLAKHNIKSNMLDDCPVWLRKWAFFIMQFIQFECVEFKKAQLAKLQGVMFKDTQYLSKQQIDSRNEIFAEVKKGDLFNARFQNLITSLDKLKYYLGSIKDLSPPISIHPPEVILKALWETNKPTKKKQPESLVFSLLVHLKKQGYANELVIIEEIDKYIRSDQNVLKKLHYARLGFLLVSHILKKRGNNSQLSDILFFTAFTHTYFTSHEYSSLDSQRMIISFKDFLTEPSKLQNQHQSCKRQYSSQFVWGQLVAWFKQTIASPQSSLSQDRRGTLSYPTIDSIARTNSYPFEGHNRSGFLKSLCDKPFSSWPPDECPWSYKNTSKAYGTILFESYFNADKLKTLEMPGVTDDSMNQGKRLIKCAIRALDGSLDEKIALFSQVEELLANIPSKEVLQSKILFWDESFEESKQSPVVINQQVQEQKIIGKRNKV